MKDVKEDVHNLAYNERKKKEIRYRIRPKQKFSLSIKIYFNLSKWQIYTFSIKKLLYQLLTLETSYCTNYNNN